MFYGELKSHSEEQQINDPNVKAKDFTTFLKFVYTGSVEVDGDNLLQLLYLAKIYDIENLRVSISEIVVNGIDNENIISLWDSANQLGETEIAKKCEEYFLLNSAKAMELIQPQRVSKDIILRILALDLDVEEIKFFQLAQKWIGAQESPSKELVEQVISLVRVAQIPSKDLVMFVKPTNLVPDRILLEALSYQLCPESFSSSPDLQFKPRAPIIPESNWAWKTCGKNSKIVGKVVEQTSNGYSLTIGDKPLKKWAIKILKLTTGWWNLVVGAALQNIDLNDYLTKSTSGWGYVSTGVLRHNSGAGGSETPDSYGVGDVIKVEVENSQVKFYKNDKLVGALNCTTNELYPVVHLCKIGDSITIVDCK
uniref:BTB domain-containing protein n=1 Tax=Arcella intermedia TaxID=1963864 RepID=A0A6B2L5G8_9EUKA